MAKFNWSKIVIAFLIVVCAWYGKNLDTWEKNSVIQNDVVSYYAYLPATFIFNDLNFQFTKELPSDFEGKIWLQDTPSGKPILRMTMGLAILWAPFFLIAHAIAHFLDVSTLGYSWPYGLSIFIASLFYLFVGLFFLRKILLRYFSDLVISIVLTLLVLATNLIYYVISEPGMPHVFNFGLITTFFYFSLKWIEQASIRNTIILGLLAGIIVLVRPINILVLLFPAFIDVVSFDDFKTRILKNWKFILLAGLAAFLVVLPQLIYWKVQTGHFFFNSYMDQGKFYFNKPQLINGLFSYRKGWLIYTPVMTLALLGFIWLKKSMPNLFYPILLFTAINIYVIYSWWCWWYGGCFGSRPMIDMYGIMAIPLGVFIKKVLKRNVWIKSIAILTLVFMLGLNQFQMNQYRTSLLHWDSMTKEAYWEIFLKKSWPKNYAEVIKVPDYEKALKGEREYPNKSK